MYWRDEIKLRAVSQTKNSYGEISETVTDKTVYANTKSVKRSEFYQAQTAGYKPEIVFEVRTIDYSSETQVIYNNLIYPVIRTYTEGFDVTEIVCGGGTHLGSNS